MIRTIDIIILVVIAHPILSFAGTITYNYDDLDRLKEVQFGDGYAMKYEYDEIGNIAKKEKLTVQ